MQVDISAVPDLSEFALIKVDLSSPACGHLEFMGDTRILSDAPRNSDFTIWTFAFFGLSIYDLDLSYQEVLPAARAIRITPISDDAHDFKYDVEVALAPGSIRMLCGRVFFFPRTAIERNVGD